jgi:hypothetical protein
LHIDPQKYTRPSPILDRQHGRPHMLAEHAQPDDVRARNQRLRGHPGELRRERSVLRTRTGKRAPLQEIGAISG